MHWNMTTASLKDALKLCGYLHPAEEDVLLTLLPKEGKSEPLLRLESADGSSYLRFDTAVKVLKPGKISLNRKLLTQLRLGENVEFQLDGAMLRYKSGRLSGQLPSSQEGFKMETLRPAKEIKTDVVVDEDSLRTLLEVTRMSPALGAPDSLPLHVHIKDGHLVGYISEQFQACLYRGRLPKDQRKQNLTFTLRPSLLLSVTPAFSNPVELAVKNGTLVVKTLTMLAHLPLNQTDAANDVEAHVFTIREEMTKKGASKGFKRMAVFTVDQTEFLKGLSTAGSALHDAGAHGVPVRCELSSKEMVLTVRSNDNAKASYKLPIEGGPEKPVRVSLSFRYLTEMLGLVGKGNVTVHVLQGLVMIESSDGKNTVVLSTMQKDDSSDDEKPAKSK